MAGANNAQMKARGWKAADITRYRASHSGPMSDAALRRAGALPKKNSHAHKALAETIRQNRPTQPARKPDAATMARGTRDLSATMMANRRAMAAKAKADMAAKRDEARRVYDAGNAASRDRLGAMRSDIRQRVANVKKARDEFDAAKSAATRRASAQFPEVKGGKNASGRRVQREFKISAAVAVDKDLSRASAAKKKAETELRSALSSRNQTALTRKQQRVSEAAGQLDLFGSSMKRGPSPYEQRLTVQRAKSADLTQRHLRGLTTTLHASRKSGEAQLSSGSATQRLKALRQLRMDRDVAKSTYLAERSRENPNRDPFYSSPRTSALAKKADSLAMAYDKASKRTFKEYSKRHQDALFSAVRLERVASNLNDKARRSNGPDSDALKARVAALYARAKAKREQARRLDPFNAARDKIRR